jgi:hypothetical protein
MASSSSNSSKSSSNSSSSSGSISVTFVSLVLAPYPAANLIGEFTALRINLHGGATHHGIVKVSPGSARNRVRIRLFQTLNSITESDKPVTWTDSPRQGNDTKFNNYSGPDKAKNVGIDQIEIESSDAPGADGGRGLWENTIPPGKTTFDANFNVYLQYSIDGKPFQTIGKATWAVHFIAVFRLNSQGDLELTTGTSTGPVTTVAPGASSHESPVAPSSPY